MCSATPNVPESGVRAGMIFVSADPEWPRVYGEQVRGLETLRGA